MGRRLNWTDGKGQVDSTKINDTTLLPHSSSIVFIRMQKHTIYLLYIYIQCHCNANQKNNTNVFDNKNINLYFIASQINIKPKQLSF